MKGGKLCEFENVFRLVGTQPKGSTGSKRIWREGFTLQQGRSNRGTTEGRERREISGYCSIKTPGPEKLETHGQKMGARLKKSPKMRSCIGIEGTVPRYRGGNNTRRKERNS